MGAAAGIGAAGSLFSGLQQMKAGSEESREAMRATGQQVKRQREDLEDAKKSQELDFLSSGVKLEGTPLEVLAETEKRGQADIKETLRSGKRQADSLRRAGRNALIGAAFQAGSTAAG